MTRPTHEHIDRGVRLLLTLVSKCTPDCQPSEPVLRALSSLLELHRIGTPAEGFDARIKALTDKVEALDTRGVFAGMLKHDRR
ncbi:MAG TPA: hypothetical protein VF653_13250 [Methylomirabilota bacterium]